MKNILIFLLIATFCSCTKPESLPDFEERTTSLNFRNQNLDLTEIVDSLFFFEDLIGLEIPNSKQIVDISKILIHESQFIILDQKYSSVSLFDDQGKFKLNYGAIGSGPGEFLDVSDITISNGSIYLLSRGSRALFQYDIVSGDFIKKIQHDLFGDRVSSIDNEEFLVYINHNPSSKGNYNIFRIDSQGEILQKYFEFDPKLQPMIISFTGNMIKTNGQVTFSKPFDEIIYSFNPLVKDFYAKYQTDLLSDFILENKGNFVKLVSPEVLVQAMNGGQSFNGNIFLENQDFIVLSFHEWSALQYLVYDKNTSNSTIFAPSSSNAFFRLINSPAILTEGNDIFFPIYGEKINKKEFYQSSSNSPFIQTFIAAKDSIIGEPSFYLLKAKIKKDA